MGNLGEWKINPTTKLPQKIASLELKLFGAEYEIKMYLGSQLVNGTRHAVLAEQTVITGVDTKNAVILVLNEKSGVTDLALESIVPIANGGGKLGGMNIDIQIEDDMPKEAMDVYHDSAYELLGSSIKPIAFLGKQVTKGTDYRLLATSTPVTLEGEPSLAVVTVNNMEKIVKAKHIEL